jgi:hypothetical protein
MKKKVLSGLAAIIAASLTAQNTFQVLNYDNNSSVIAANGIVYAQVNADDTHQANIDIRNTSGSAQTYGVRRFDVTLNANGTSTAEAFFCFGGDCYTPGITDSQNPITLQPNEKSSDLSGQFQMLLAELKEISVTGLSIVKYTFYNVNNANDTLQFAFHYNDPAVGLHQKTFVRPSLTLAPNPARGSAQAIVTVGSATDCDIAIYNALGALVSTSKAEVREGTHTLSLDLSQLRKGVYFVSVSTTGQTTVQRLIVE